MFWKISNSLTPLIKRSDLIQAIQFYSIIPPHYVNPIYKKDDLKALYKKDDWKKIIQAPVKPASNSDTCSEFHDPLTRKFITYLMRDGKQKLARKLIEETFETIKLLQLETYYNSPPEHRESVILDPKQILYLAVENCKPVLELTRIRRGGIVYQVPVPVSDSKVTFLSMNWLIQATHDKGTKAKFSYVMAKELITAAKNEGRVVKKKQDLHKQCEANRAYAHYRWM